MKNLIKTFVTCLAILLTVVYGTPAADWSTEHKTVFTIGTMLNLADISQTTYIYNHPDEFRETNPLMTEDAYLPLMVGMNIFVWWMADKNEDSRGVILYPFAIIKGMVLISNIRQGCGFSLSF